MRKDWSSRSIALSAIVLCLPLVGIMTAPAAFAAYTLLDYQSPFALGTTWLYTGKDWDGNPSETRVEVVDTALTITTVPGSTPVEVIALRLDYGYSDTSGQFVSSDDWREYVGANGSYRIWGHDDGSESIRTTGLDFGAILDVGQTKVSDVPVYDSGVLVGSLHGEISLLGVESVTVPAATFNGCLHLRVAVSGVLNQVWDEWWAPGIGTVKMVGISGDGSGRLRELVKHTVERYDFAYEGVYTYHRRYTPSGNIETFASAEAEFLRQPDNLPAAEDAITSFSVIPPAGTCTDVLIERSQYSQVRFRDSNNDGRIDPLSELPARYISHGTNAGCRVASGLPPAGLYQFQANMANGQILTRTVMIAVPYSQSQAPPVENLAAGWDSVSNELELTWDIPNPPGTYPAGTYIDIRIYSFTNGHWRSDQVRITNLPPILTGFTLTPVMTEPFNLKAVDQLRIEVRHYVPDNVKAIARGIFDFDGQVSGTLQEAPITMTRLDVDGDGLTGLPEAIYSLQAVSNK